MANQEIKCNVHSCRHNDKMMYCSLHDITVGNSVSTEAHRAEETECASFAPMV
jgi:hypothetical protein